MKRNNILQNIATLSAIMLWAFILFVSGVVVGQTEKFQRAWKDIQSGRFAAELLPYANDSFDKQLTVWNTVPHALQGGALLIGSHFSENPALLLVDEEGNILHRWQVEPKIFNSEILQWWKTLPDPTQYVFAVDDAHLLPGGDVIFIQDLRSFVNYRGQRLARMDRDSHVLWQVPGSFTHEIDIAGNPQRIYAGTSHRRGELPVIGPKLENVTYLEDQIEEYTLDGKKVNAWSVVEAFAHSKYRSLLTSFEIDLPERQRVKMPDGRVLYDLLLLNSLQYLDAAQAKALPFAREGDLLISLRGLNALAVLRPASGEIVWAAQGPWRHQHHVRATEDGRLYIFDNEGSRVLAFSKNGEPKEKLQSRVIRYNPFNNQTEEVFASTTIHSFWRGYYIPLDNGAWIIASPQHSRVIVVSPDKDIVWELRGVPDRDMQTVPYRKQISTVRYYPATALAFLHSQKAAP